jgi:hypothetical protein
MLGDGHRGVTADSAASAACSFSSMPMIWLTNNSADAYMTHNAGRASSAAAGNAASQFSTGATAPRKSSGIPRPSASRAARSMSPAAAAW